MNMRSQAGIEMLISLEVFDARSGKRLFCRLGDARPNEADSRAYLDK